MNSLPSEFASRLIPLHDGRPGLRGTLQVEVQPAGAPLDSQPSTINSQHTLDFISSTETLDRYGEVIAADGWKLDNYRRNPVFQNAHQYGDIIFTLGKALITEVRTGLVGRSCCSAPINPREAPETLSTINHPGRRGSAALPSPREAPETLSTISHPGRRGSAALPSPREAPRSLSTINQHPSTCLFQRIEFAVEANPMARIAYALYKGKFLNAVSVGFIPLRWQDGPSDGRSDYGAARQHRPADGTIHPSREAPRQLSTLN